MAKKTYTTGLLLVALSFMLGACSSQSYTKAPVNDKQYERVHERSTPIVATADRN